MKKAVVVSCFGWYERRLYYLCKKLEDSDYSVKYYSSDYMHIGKKRRKAADDRFTYIHVPAYNKNISMRRFYSHYVFAKKVFAELNSEKPDFVYVLVPPNMVANTALKYKKKHPDTKLVIDIIDLWPESFPNMLIQKPPLFPFWRNLRNHALDCADKIVLECDYYQECIGSQYSGKCTVLRLQKPCSAEDFEAIQAGLPHTKESFEKKEISLCYLGSVNNIVDIASIREVLLALRSAGFTVHFHFIGKGSGKQALLDAVKEAGGTVYDHGAVFDEAEKSKIMRECDFGVNMMKPTIKVGLTMKSIDYLYNGLPLLNSIKGDTWRLVEENHIGLNYKGDPVQLVEAVRNCRIREMRNAALTCFQERFSTEGFEKNYDGIINEITK